MLAINLTSHGNNGFCNTGLSILRRKSNSLHSPLFISSLLLFPLKYPPTVKWMPIAFLSFRRQWSSPFFLIHPLPGNDSHQLSWMEFRAECSPL